MIDFKMRFSMARRAEWDEVFNIVISSVSIFVMNLKYSWVLTVLTFGASRAVLFNRQLSVNSFPTFPIVSFLFFRTPYLKNSKRLEPSADSRVRYFSSYSYLARAVPRIPKLPCFSFVKFFRPSVGALSRAVFTSPFFYFALWGREGVAACSTRARNVCFTSDGLPQFFFRFFRPIMTGWFPLLKCQCLLLSGDRDGASFVSWLKTSFISTSWHFKREFYAV